MEYLVQVCILRSVDQNQGHTSKKECLCALLAGGLPSVERQCLLISAADVCLGSGYSAFVVV